MSVPSVVYSREVPLAAQSLHEAVGGVLESIAGRSRTDAIALSALVGNSSGKVSVPIELTVARPLAGNSSIVVSIKARSAEALFPTFKGVFDALAMAPARTNLRLKGSYNVPFGPLGSAMNVAGMHKMAEDSLREFFEQVADETIAAVREDLTRRIREGHTAP